MAETEHVPVTREGALNILKLLMIALAAGILWQAAAAVNLELQDRNLVTAPPFTRAIGRLLFGMETDAPFQSRLADLWHASHRTIAMAAMLIATALLGVRYLFSGRALDFLYLESGTAQERRVYTGFIIHIFYMLVHAGAIYGLVFFSHGEHVAMVPIIMLFLLALNVAWFGATLSMASLEEKHGLRGLWALMATAIAVFFVLLGSTLAIEARHAADRSARESLLIVVTAAAAFVLCVLDGYLQARIYAVRPRSDALPPPADAE